MRSKAKLKEVDNPRLASGMLMMRRHEKDFMLRRDQTYVEAFQNSANEFAKACETSDLSAASEG